MNEQTYFIILALIISISILTFTAILSYASTINNLYKSPYKQCLDTCAGSGNNLECAKTCTEEFSKALDNLTTKLVPVLEKYLESSK